MILFLVALGVSARGPDGEIDLQEKEARWAALNRYKDSPVGKGVTCQMCGRLLLPLKILHDQMVNQLKAQRKSTAVWHDNSEIVEQTKESLKAQRTERDTCMMFMQSDMFVDDDRDEQFDQQICHILFHYMFGIIAEEERFSDNEFFETFCEDNDYCRQPRPNHEEAEKKGWEGYEKATAWTRKSDKDIDVVVARFYSHMSEFKAKMRAEYEAKNEL